MAMRVMDVNFERNDCNTLLEGTVNGTRFFWKTSAPRPIEARGEPFVAALLPAAMRARTAIELPDSIPLDPTFLDNVNQLQAVFARWFPELQPVAINAATMAPRNQPATGKATGYSGGVDSSYSLDALGDRIDSALLIDGIEYRERAPELFDQIEHDLGDTMAKRGLDLIRVETNVKAAQRALGALWSESIGGAIASVIHFAGFEEYHIAASNSWENLRPYGSHPLTDPMWSSLGTRIDHHGTELRRIQKIRYLRGVPDLLERIRVCFQGTAWNCGVCHKCLQTSAGFRALQLTSPALPPLTEPRLLRKMTVEHKGDLVDWQELIVPGLEQRDPELHRELTRLVRRFRWRQIGRDLDQQLTGGWLRRSLRHRNVGRDA